MAVDEPEIVRVEESLDDVERRLGGGEAVVGVVGRPAVVVVDAAVEGVGYPEGAVQGAAGHAVWAQEDVERVPDHEGEGDEEPEEG